MPHLPLFATPVSMYDLPSMDEINRDLTARLVAESVSIPSVHRSNVGGWHSQNLAGRPEACFRTLLQCIVTRVRETVEGLAQESGQGLPAMRIGVHAWAMVMRNGDYTIPHDHSEVHWATVYYADAGDADEGAHPASGLLALVDPRHGGRPMPGIELLGTHLHGAAAHRAAGGFSGVAAPLRARLPWAAAARVDLLQRHLRSGFAVAETLQSPRALDREIH